ncbi:hypothetical protein [Ornithinibacillus halophilus]|uniref:Uncharacterized protein n=1 Tax=Ornithinibacillus halophilus TaxID=930117 RepID=A0A1M5CK70_9BACI|nr:hypothetical protein [Ornithinibacillus halophilus]SHF54997.1 hypothetical protein SAMN05216225_1001279 [Ornithinibacillus halophilus]
MGEKKDEQIQSLISISPTLYRLITRELENQYHIHSYDIQVFGIREEDGIRVIIRHGDDFAHKKEQFFFFKQIEDVSDELKDFITSTGESCKQVLIDDYFKRMAP